MLYIPLQLSRIPGTCDLIKGAYSSLPATNYLISFLITLQTFHPQESSKLISLLTVTMFLFTLDDSYVSRIGDKGVTHTLEHVSVGGLMLSNRVRPGRVHVVKTIKIIDL